MSPARFLLRRLRRFLGADDGPTATEYAVMLALIMLVCTASIRVLGCNVQRSLANTARSLSK
jgi:pilus assembly protein Flp/PilA